MFIVWGLRYLFYKGRQSLQLMINLNYIDGYYRQFNLKNKILNFQLKLVVIVKEEIVDNKI